MAFGFRYCLVYLWLPLFLLLLHHHRFFLALAASSIACLASDFLITSGWIALIVVVPFVLLHRHLNYLLLHMAFGFRYRLVYFRFCSFFFFCCRILDSINCLFLSSSYFINCLSCFYFFVISGWIALIKFVPFVLAVSTFSFLVLDEFVP